MTSVVRELAPVGNPETAKPERRSETEMVKVSASSRPSAAAGAIAGIIRERGLVEVQSIGAGATNQAIKAVAIARSYLREEGVDLICTPSFLDVMIDGEKRTAICLQVEKRALAERSA